MMPRTSPAVASGLPQITRDGTRLLGLEESLLDPSSEGPGIDGREAEELGLDLVEVGEGAGGVDERALDHFQHVAAILVVRSLRLPQRPGGRGGGGENT